MRFMVLVKANAESESGKLPTEQELVEMGKFNSELAKAGVMLSAEGLHASSKGARIDLTRKKPVVTDGPFTETKELIAGFWIVQAKSKEEVIEWFKRCPPTVGVLEVRQVFDLADFAFVETDAGRAVLENAAEFRKPKNA